VTSSLGTGKSITFSYSVEGWILDQQAGGAKKRKKRQKSVGFLQDVQSKFKSLQLPQQEAKLK
jgi:hypothetical protein